MKLVLERELGIVTGLAATHTSVLQNFHPDYSTQGRNKPMLSVHLSVLSISLQPHELQPTRLPCPSNSPGKSIGVGSHSFLQEIFSSGDQTRISVSQISYSSRLVLGHWHHLVNPLCVYSSLYFQIKLSHRSTQIWQKPIYHNVIISRLKKLI